MRILFAITHDGFLRNFESTLALLAARGHQIHLVTDRKSKPGAVTDGAPILARLQAAAPDAFTVDTVPVPKDGWHAVSMLVREGLNYWRYLTPTYDASPDLRARGRTQAPAAVVRLVEWPLLRSQAGIRLLTRVFRALERALPVRPGVEAAFDRIKPDVVLLTPLLYFGSRQVEYVRVARRRGIPSVLGVGSWDHLTTKGVIHEAPDRLVVWNGLQQTEAVELHGVPREDVIVTGAQAYDHWFATEPSGTREDFASRVGLPADRPYLLYLCSSPFIAPREVDVVRRWIEAVRRADDPRLRAAGLLVRPHPQNAAQWADVDLSGYGDVTIWPRAGANPVGPEARRDYYDSMYHAHAVVGVNTSALIESGIVGRLVYSFHVPELAGTQEGTLHFRHLRREGLLRLAETLDEHTAQLAASLDSSAEDRARIREFIRVFVRPHGLDQPATPRVVEAIESAASLTPRPARTSMLAPVLRLLLSGAAALGGARPGRSRA